MTASEVMAKLPKELVCSGRVKRTDNLYQVPIDPAYVMKKIKSWKYDYIPEQRDCDAFVDIFRGVLAKKGYGNLLAMGADVTFHNGKGHCLIAFMDLKQLDNDGKHPLIFGEPQTGEIINLVYSNIKLRA